MSEMGSGTAVDGFALSDVDLTQPRLVVFTSSRAFADLWPVLAAGCGASLSLTTHRGDISPNDGTVALVVANGSEVDDLVGWLVGNGVATAVVNATSGVRHSNGFTIPVDQDALGAWLAKEVDSLRLRAAHAKFTVAERGKYRFDEIVGTSAGLAAALASAIRAIPDGLEPVFLTGEAGTGKTLVARAIHYQGPRQSAPFVVLDCASADESGLKLAMFGQEHDTDGGATRIKPGFFELARGGTLLLNGITHLTAALQRALHRAADEGVIRRGGGAAPIPVDVRIFATSLAHPTDAVRRGTLSRGLHDRLGGSDPIVLPPLRARREDIVPLARHFTEQLAAENGWSAVVLDHEDEVELTARDWPGNVRELRGAVERLLLLSTASSVRLSDALTPRAADTSS